MVLKLGLHPDMIPGINIIDKKASEVSNMQLLQAPVALGGLGEALSSHRES